MFSTPADLDLAVTAALKAQPNWASINPQPRACVMFEFNGVDADLDQVVNDLCGAAYGSAGKRCMALPVVVLIGEKTAIALRENFCRQSLPCASVFRPTRMRTTIP